MFFLMSVLMTKAGDLTVDGDLYVNSNMTITGTSQFNSDATLASNLYVSGTGVMNCIHIPLKAFSSQKILLSYWDGLHERTNFIYGGGHLVSEEGPLHAVGVIYDEMFTIGGGTTRLPIRWYWYDYLTGIKETKLYPDANGEPIWDNLTKTNTSKLVCEGAASVSLGGDLTVQTNLTVNGKAYISSIQPMGDIAMGTFTNMP